MGVTTLSDAEAMRADVKANCFDMGEVAQNMCHSLMMSMAVSCHSLCTRFRFNTRLRFNTRSQCRAEGAPLARRRRAVNGHERRRRECAAVHKERQVHGQRYARSEVSTRFMVTSGEVN